MKMEEISIRKIQQGEEENETKKGILHSQVTKLGYNVNVM